MSTSPSDQLFYDYCGVDDVQYEVTVYFARKFEALRKFYIGNQRDFIESIA